MLNILLTRKWLTLKEPLNGHSLFVQGNEGFGTPNRGFQEYHYIMDETIQELCFFHIIRWEMLVLMEFAGLGTIRFIIWVYQVLSSGPRPNLLGFDLDPYPVINNWVRSSLSSAHLWPFLLSLVSTQ